METTIGTVLRALNEVEVKGEKNHDLLLYAIQQLKALQSALLENTHEQDDPT